MNVIAYASSILRLIVIAKDGELIATSDNHLGNIGHEVVGHAVRVLA